MTLQFKTIPGQGEPPPPPPQGLGLTRGEAARIPSSKQTRILLLTSVLPWPIHRNGGAQRTALLRRALLESGYEVEVMGVLPDIKGSPELNDALRSHGIASICKFPLYSDKRQMPRRPLLRRLLGALTGTGHVQEMWRLRYSLCPTVSAAVEERLATGQFSHVVVRYLITALVAGLDNPAKRGGTPCLVDLDDVDWVTLQTRFQLEPWPGVRGRLGMKAVLSTVRHRCLHALPTFDACFAASNDDCRELADLTTRCEVLPNLPFPPGAIQPDEPDLQCQRVLFVGDLQFPPNRHGLEGFLDDVWPQVRAAHPEAELMIVGRGLAPADADRWSKLPGVQPAGFVEDLAEPYRASAVVVAPVWWGGGTKIKVLEALSRGRGCVTTSHGARGYDELVKADCGLVVATGPQEMAEAVGAFLAEPGLRRQAWARGPGAVNQRFGFETFRKQVADALQTVQKSAPAGPTGGVTQD